MDWRIQNEINEMKTKYKIIIFKLSSFKRVIIIFKILTVILLLLSVYYDIIILEIIFGTLVFLDVYNWIKSKY